MQLRPKAHNFTLPHIHTTLFKNSFINRCIFDIVWLPLWFQSPIVYIHSVLYLMDIGHCIFTFVFIFVYVYLHAVRLSLYFIKGYLTWLVTVVLWANRPLMMMMMMTVAPLARWHVDWPNETVIRQTHVIKDCNYWFKFLRHKIAKHHCELERDDSWQIVLVAEELGRVEHWLSAEIPRSTGSSRAQTMTDNVRLPTVKLLHRWRARPPENSSEFL